MFGSDRFSIEFESIIGQVFRSDKGVFSVDWRRAAEAVAPYVKAAAAARENGLGINAGHDLNLDNLAYFLKQVGGVDEVSIGHALIADALEFGLAGTVKRYLDECG